MKKSYIVILGFLFFTQTTSVRSTNTTKTLATTTFASTTIAAQAYCQYSQDLQAYKEKTITRDEFFKKREPLQKRFFVSVAISVISGAATLWSVMKS